MIASVRFVCAGVCSRWTRWENQRRPLCVKRGGGFENGFVCGTASLLYGMQVQSVGKKRYIQKKKAGLMLAAALVVTAAARTSCSYEPLLNALQRVC